MAKPQQYPSFQDVFLGLFTGGAKVKGRAAPQQPGVNWANTVILPFVAAVTSSAQLAENLIHQPFEKAGERTKEIHTKVFVFDAKEGKKQYSAIPAGRLRKWAVEYSPKVTHPTTALPSHMAGVMSSPGDISAKLLGGAKLAPDIEGWLSLFTDPTLTAEVVAKLYTDSKKLIARKQLLNEFERIAGDIAIRLGLGIGKAAAASGMPRDFALSVFKRNLELDRHWSTSLVSKVSEGVDKLMGGTDPNERFFAQSVFRVLSSAGGKLGASERQRLYATVLHHLDDNFWQGLFRSVIAGNSMDVAISQNLGRLASDPFVSGVVGVDRARRLLEDIARDSNVQRYFALQLARKRKAIQRGLVIDQQAWRRTLARVGVDDNTLAALDSVLESSTVEASARVIERVDRQQAAALRDAYRDLKQQAREVSRHPLARTDKKVLLNPRFWYEWKLLLSEYSKELGKVTFWDFVTGEVFRKLSGAGVAGVLELDHTKLKQITAFWDQIGQLNFADPKVGKFLKGLETETREFLNNASPHLQGNPLLRRLAADYKRFARLPSLLESLRKELQREGINITREQLLHILHSQGGRGLLTRFVRDGDSERKRQILSRIARYWDRHDRFNQMRKQSAQNLEYFTDSLGGDPDNLPWLAEPFRRFLPAQIMYTAYVLHPFSLARRFLNGDLPWMFFHIGTGFSDPEVIMLLSMDSTSDLMHVRQYLLRKYGPLKGKIYHAFLRRGIRLGKNKYYRMWLKYGWKRLSTLYMLLTNPHQYLFYKYYEVVYKKYILKGMRKLARKIWIKLGGPKLVKALGKLLAKLGLRKLAGAILTYVSAGLWIIYEFLNFISGGLLDKILMSIIYISFALVFLIPLAILIQLATIDVGVGYSSNSMLPVVSEQITAAPLDKIKRGSPLIEKLYQDIEGPYKEDEAGPGSGSDSSDSDIVAFGPACGYMVDAFWEEFTGNESLPKRMPDGASFTPIEDAGCILGDTPYGIVQCSNGGSSYHQKSGAVDLIPDMAISKRPSSVLLSPVNGVVAFCAEGGRNSPNCTCKDGSAGGGEIIIYSAGYFYKFLHIYPREDLCKAYKSGKYPTVRKGEVITQGYQVPPKGGDACSGGLHLHFEVLKYRGGKLVPAYRESCEFVAKTCNRKPTWTYSRGCPSTCRP